MPKIASFFLRGGNAFTTSSSAAYSGDIKVNEETDYVYADRNLTLKVGIVTRHAKVNKLSDSLQIKNVTVNYHMIAGDLIGNGFRFTATIPTPSLVGTLKSSIMGTWGSTLAGFQGYVNATDLGDSLRQVDLYSN